MTLELEKLEETEACRVDPPTTFGNTGEAKTSQAALEAFPNVLKKIASLWGTRELDKLIMEMIMDSREGTRQGFPVDAADELMFLEGCNQYVRALEISKNMNIDVKKAMNMVVSGDQAHKTVDPWNDPTISKDASVHVKKSPNATTIPPYKLEEQRLYGEPEKKSSSTALLWAFLLVIAVAAAAKFLLPRIG